MRAFEHRLARLATTPRFRDNLGGTPHPHTFSQWRLAETAVDAGLINPSCIIVRYPFVACMNWVRRALIMHHFALPFAHGSAACMCGTLWLPLRHVFPISICPLKGHSKCSSTFGRLRPWGAASVQHTSLPRQSWSIQAPGGLLGGKFPLH